MYNLYAVTNNISSHNLLTTSPQSTFFTKFPDPHHIIKQIFNYLRKRDNIPAVSNFAHPQVNYGVEFSKNSCSHTSDAVHIAEKG